MVDLIVEIRAAVGHEYDRAAKLNGPTFSSMHEAYAVILEEYEEAQEEAESFEDQLKDFWGDVKSNKSPICDMQKTNEYIKNELESMRTTAINAAAEWTQVAAMCHKAIKSSEK